MPQYGWFESVTFHTNIWTGDQEYWEHRYEEKDQSFDWFFSYANKAFRDLICKYAQKGSHILQIGCGNSRVAEQMADDGFLHITKSVRDDLFGATDVLLSIDVSEVVINQMKQRYQQRLAADDSSNGLKCPSVFVLFS